MKQENNTPLVSVVMPVYNAAPFLKEAIQSILDQTFKDFELIIINDGSTDNSLEVTRSLSDPRIVLLDNGKNLGITRTLNKGLRAAKGKYIARMDADDISMRDRLQKQVKYLEKNKAVVVATRIEFINTEGKITGTWSDDVQFIEPAAIRHAMAFTNCIAHPSIMAEATLLKKYKYRAFQKGAEDWDLWMRMLADGHTIAKLDEVLLRYRIHPASVMSSEKKSTSLQTRLILAKRRFLLHQLPKLNGYFFLVVYSLFRSMARKYKVDVMPRFLRNIKRLLTISPFTASAQYHRLKKTLAAEKPNLVFFFPYTHIGGAEKVHADITSVFKDQKPLVIFTGFSKDEKFLDKFRDNGIVCNIPQALNYPAYREKCMHLLAEHLNKGSRILGANSAFFYDLCERLGPQVQINDLIHAFVYEPGGNNDHKKYIAVSQKFSNRIFISSAALDQFKQFAFHENCAGSYFEKLKLVLNYTPVEALQPKSHQVPLQVLFVGRNSPEKRIELILAVADRLNKSHPGKFSFSIVGVSGQHEGVKFRGEITDEAELKSLYNTAHVLLVTSSREGFPMVIMEAMAHGVVPISTPVGDIPVHVTPQTGFTTSSTDAQIVVEQMAERLTAYSGNSAELDQLSNNAYDYARNTFSWEKFAAAYRALLR